MGQDSRITKENVMVCPKCGYSEGNHVAKKQQSDKDFYLEFWGYTLGTPEAEEA